MKPLIRLRKLKKECKDGVFAPINKQLTQVVLEGELEPHLSEEKNCENGKFSKTLKNSVGEFDLEIMIDRNGGSFEPLLIKKYQPYMSIILNGKYFPCMPLATVILI